MQAGPHLVDGWQMINYKPWLGGSVFTGEEEPELKMARTFMEGIKPGRVFHETMMNCLVIGFCEDALCPRVCPPWCMITDWSFYLRTREYAMRNWELPKYGNLSKIRGFKFFPNILVKRHTVRRFHKINPFAFYRYRLLSSIDLAPWIILRWTTEHSANKLWDKHLHFYVFSAIAFLSNIPPSRPSL